MKQISAQEAFTLYLMVAAAPDKEKQKELFLILESREGKRCGRSILRGRKWPFE